MENDRITKCAGSRSVGRPRNKRIDILKDCLKKNGLECQAIKENGAWRGFVRGNAYPGDEPLPYGLTIDVRFFQVEKVKNSVIAPVLELVDSP